MTRSIHWQVDRPADVDDTFVAQCVRAALQHGERSHWSVNVVFVDEPTLTRLHVDLFADPTPTDVITVDLSGDDAFDGDGSPHGEVFVSVDRARDVAVRRGHSLAREIGLYVVHGVLHLCGWDDVEPSDRVLMRAAERDVMRALCFADETLEHDEE